MNKSSTELSGNLGGSNSLKNKASSKTRYLTTEQRRSALKLAYDDRAWIDKVDKMPSKQVYAIFDTMRKSGQIAFDDAGNLFFRSKEEVRKIKESSYRYHQITLDEWAKEQEASRIDKERKEIGAIKHGQIS